MESEQREIRVVADAMGSVSWCAENTALAQRCVRYVRAANDAIEADRFATGASHAAHQAQLAHRVCDMRLRELPHDSAWVPILTAIVERACMLARNAVKASDEAREASRGKPLLSRGAA